MKKVLVTLLLALSVFAVTANAQLTPGHKAMDFTFTPLNNDGVPVHLYDWLDAGKYVLLDISATWCSPCWALHTSGLLEELYTTYGPGTTADDIRVVFIEGDASTTDEDMNGTGSNTQGNWLEGTPFPMCNPTAEEVAVLDKQYNYGYFPTLYVICPDRTIRELDRSTYNTVTKIHDNMVNGACPTMINVDGEFANLALAHPLISCDGTFGFSFSVKNFGAQNMTAFTVNLKADGQTYATQSWTGDIPSYESSDAITLESSEIPAGTGYLALELVLDGDQSTDGNTYAFKIGSYSDASKYTLPYTENLNSYTAMPNMFATNTPTAGRVFYFFDGINGEYAITGPDGENANTILIPFYNLNSTSYTGVLCLGSFNGNIDADTLKFEFDESYAMYPGSTTDKLEVVYSTDCGSTWKSAWSKTSNSLKTTDTTSQFYMPSDAAQWKHFATTLKVIGQENVLFGFRATSGYGNNCWLANFKLSSIKNVPAEDPQTVQIGISPNPAMDYFTVRGYNGEAKLYDVTGRIVWSGKVTDGEEINIESLVPGVYYINLSGNIQKFVKQ